jgi:23S rRNA pseudouridine2605 synthase
VRLSRRQHKGVRLLSSTPEFNAEQLTAARAKVWHQTGEPLLTLDAIREWLATAGLVLFTPRSLQLPTPAPSFVEAMLGSANVGPTPAQIETARSLLARLISEGNALPLNLLGVPGELPDFVVSAQVFSYIFTMRGDKAWKLPPATSGAVKVSPLGLRIYEVLTERGALTASELAQELGREVTEGAILRTLNELWSLLRVIPLPQQGESATLWELTTRRFTKAIKAGVNAGQPKALSALISLYLAQSLLATEDEVEIFLSPLAARSRIREVLHALTAARQLETIVLDGRSLLHIPGTLPEFPAIEKPEATEEEPASAASLEGEGRIKRFTPGADRKPRSDFKGKPVRSFGAKSERERRPFRRNAAPSADEKPSFTRPWDEDRKSRPERSGFSPRAEGDQATPKRPYVRREGAAPGGFAKRESFSDRGSARRSFGEKPAFRKDRGEGFAGKPRFAKDGERKPYGRREESGFGDRPRRGYGDKPAGSDSFAKFRKPGREDRKPFRRDEGDAPREGFRPRPSYGGSNSTPRPPKRPYVRRDEGEGAGSRPDSRSGFRPRPAGDRPFSKPRFDRGDSKPGGFGAKRPYVRRDEASGERPSYGGNDSTPRTPKRPFPRKAGDLSDRPVRPWPEAKSERSEGRPPRRDNKPGGGFAGKSGGFSKRPAGRGGKGSFGSKPGFGKRPAGGGGFKPPARKRRPESEE